MGWGEFIVIKVVWHFSPVECENRYLDLEVVSQSHLARQTNFDKLIEKQGENNELLPDEKKTANRTSSLLRACAVYTTINCVSMQIKFSLIKL